MKFRALLNDQLCMKDFSSKGNKWRLLLCNRFYLRINKTKTTFCLDVVATFAKLSKRATINITEDGLSLSNIGTAINSNLKLWSVIRKDDFFAQYAMKGVDDDHNEIWLNFHPGQFGAFHSIHFNQILFYTFYF